MRYYILDQGFEHSDEDLDEIGGSDVESCTGYAIGYTLYQILNSDICDICTRCCIAFDEERYEMPDWLADNSTEFIVPNEG